MKAKKYFIFNKKVLWRHFSTPVEHFETFRGAFLRATRSRGLARTPENFWFPTGRKELTIEIPVTRRTNASGRRESERVTRAWDKCWDDRSIIRGRRTGARNNSECFSRGCKLSAVQSFNPQVHETRNNAFVVCI